MSLRINAPKREEVATEAQQIFDGLEKQLKMVPNIYAAMAHSPSALAANLAFSGAQAKGNLNAKEREAVNLAVSEINGCDYCRSAHTTIGQMAGLTEDEALQSRRGTIDDPKLGPLTRLARAITENRGRNVDAELDEFEKAGYTKAHLIDVLALVADKTFTNYLYALGDFEIDFPVAKEL
jgi:uncharacterized peroxidase-related enzyme